MSQAQPDAREVNRLEALVTVPEAAQVDAFLERCKVGSTWEALIRTASVTATVRARGPLGGFSERDCLCLSLALSLPVPVEPGLRFGLRADDGTELGAVGVVRPWGG
jgi:hypothetical protein